MKKEIILKSVLIVSVIASLVNFLLINGVVFAQTNYDMNTAAEELAKDSPIKNPSDILRILEKIVFYVYTVFFIIAVLFIIIAAFNFLTAGGDPEKVKSARSQILWAVVAIAIALLSVGASTIIRNFIANPGSTTFNVPSEEQGQS